MMRYDADHDRKQPGWYQRLVDNPHLEAIMIADAEGQILRSTYPLRSSQDHIASMFQALEVLAQALMHEFDSDHVCVIHLMMSDCHVLLYPLLDSLYFLLVQIERSAPLMLVTVEMNRVIEDVTLSDLNAMQHETLPVRTESDLDAEELIDAVQEWLHNRPARST